MDPRGLPPDIRPQNLLFGLLPLLSAGFGDLSAGFGDLSAGFQEKQQGRQRELPPSSLGALYVTSKAPLNFARQKRDKISAVQMLHQMCV